MIVFEHELEHKHSPAASTWYAKALLRESWMNLKTTQMLPFKWPEWEEPSLPLPMLNKIIQKTATLTQLPFCWPREAPFPAGDLLSFGFSCGGSTFPIEWQGNTWNKKKIGGWSKHRETEGKSFSVSPILLLLPSPKHWHPHTSFPRRKESPPNIWL